MQTFVPEKTYADCARVLDRQRLGKQRVECLQIMNVITGAQTSHGWQNHPACNMWRDCPDALLMYSLEVCDEWMQRGYKDTCRDKIRESFRAGVKRGYITPTGILIPDWWGDDRIHASHRSNLLRKNPHHYRQYWPDDSDDLEYHWPVKGKK